MANPITVRQFFQSLAEGKGLGGQIDTNKDGKFSEELDTAAFFVYRKFTYLTLDK